MTNGRRSMAFERKTELFVGVFKDAAMELADAGKKAKQEGYLIDGLDYEFDITQSTDYYKDSATFTIYNPNDETAQEIMTRGCSVIFRAGYSDEDMATIFLVLLTCMANNTLLYVGIYL